MLRFIHLSRIERRLYWFVVMNGSTTLDHAVAQLRSEGWWFVALRAKRAMLSLQAKRVLDVRSWAFRPSVPPPEKYEMKLSAESESSTDVLIANRRHGGTS